MHEPGAFNIVSVGFQPPCPTRPIHLEEKVQMMRLCIEDTIRKNRYQIAERLLNLALLFRSGQFRPLLHQPEEVGIGFDNMQMGVLALWVVRIEVRKAHVGNRLPIARSGLYIPSILLVQAMFLYAAI